MDELLRRSETVPLIINTDFHAGSKPGPIRALEKALQSMERVQDIWITCASKDVVDIIHARPTSAASLLRSLHLYLSNTLPGAVPGLQEVHLMLCHPPYSTDLRKLTLYYFLNDT